MEDEKKDDGLGETWQPEFSALKEQLTNLSGQMTELGQRTQQQADQLADLQQTHRALNQQFQKDQENRNLQVEPTKAKPKRKEIETTKKNGESTDESGESENEPKPKDDQSLSETKEDDPSEASRAAEPTAPPVAHKRRSI